MIQVGTLVDGKYKILEKIGQGGMSVVWLAIYERLERLVAIKEIRKAGTEYDKIVRVYFRMEIDILKKLKHPGLPTIFDVIDTDDTFLIVMTYVEGETLSQLLKKQGAQPQELVIDWCKQLCDILDYLHNRLRPIIYGDMKPANIILQPDGRLVLIDFGIAGEFGSEKMSVMYTRGYAAPEQYSAESQIDIRTDIYSLGVTLHQMVTGKNPIESPNELKPIRQYNPELSENLERIIEKCTQIDPNQRYQSILELKNALITNDSRIVSHKYIRLFHKDFLCKTAQLWIRLIRVGKLPDAWKKEKIDKPEDKSDAAVSHVTENLDKLCYNAELLMSLYSDDDMEI